MPSRLLVLVSLVALLAVDAGSAGATAIPIDNHPFHLRYIYTDLPVTLGMVTRTWVWGPGPVTAGMDEPYAESPGGMRRVQYFDKSRMEMTHPDADPASWWFVTNGLLVVELTSGRTQVGDATFQQRAPSQQNVAGDQISDPASPTYATVATVLGRPARPVGELILERLAGNGTISTDASMAAAGISGAYLVPETQHVVASVFWNFLNSTGLVTDGGMVFEGALFPNPFYASGFPISEAYWTRVPVAGAWQDVLLQCFERHCLTYTPGNPAGWQVEAGNVGRHYYEWRYGAPPATIAAGRDSAP